MATFTRASLCLGRTTRQACARGARPPPGRAACTCVPG